MPEQRVRARAQRDKVEGKAASTQAGEFVREEIHHVREGKHGARSPQQVIAIGLSKARRAGVDLPPPKRGRTSKRTGRNAEREGRRAASRSALSRHARSAAARKRPVERSAAARKAAQTKGPARRKAAAKKAAQTRLARTRSRHMGRGA